MDRVSRPHEHSRMLWCLKSPNLRPAQLSTKVTPAENVIIFGKNKVLWLFGLLTWIVDCDYMSIPRCYDILKKLLSNCDSWKGLSEPLCGSVNMIWGKRGPTKFMVRLCFAFKIQPQASFGEPREHLECQQTRNIPWPAPVSSFTQLRKGFGPGAETQSLF